MIPYVRAEEAGAYWSLHLSAIAPGMLHNMPPPTQEAELQQHKPPVTCRSNQFKLETLF